MISDVIGVEQTDVSVSGLAPGMKNDLAMVVVRNNFSDELEAGVVSTSSTSRLLPGSER